MQADTLKKAHISGRDAGKCMPFLYLLFAKLHPLTQVLLGRLASNGESLDP